MDGWWMYGCLPSHRVFFLFLCFRFVFFFYHPHPLIGHFRAFLSLVRPEVRSPISVCWTTNSALRYCFEHSASCWWVSCAPWFASLLMITPLHSTSKLKKQISAWRSKLGTHSWKFVLVSPIMCSPPTIHFCLWLLCFSELRCLPDSSILRIPTLLTRSPFWS